MPTSHLKFIRLVLHRDFRNMVFLSPGCKACYHNIYFVLASLTWFLVLHVSVAGLWATSDKASDSKSKRKSVRFP